MAHFLTAAIEATSEADNDGDANTEQKKIFENFIAKFVTQVCSFLEVLQTVF